MCGRYDFFTLLDSWTFVLLLLLQLLHLHLLQPLRPLIRNSGYLVVNFRKFPSESFWTLSAVERWCVVAAWHWTGLGEWLSPCRWRDADIGRSCVSTSMLSSSVQRAVIVCANSHGSDVHLTFTLLWRHAWTTATPFTLGHPSPAQTSCSEYWMLPLAWSATRGSTTAASAISCTTSCTD